MKRLRKMGVRLCQYSILYSYYESTSSFKTTMNYQSAACESGLVLVNGRRLAWAEKTD